MRAAATAIIGTLHPTIESRISHAAINTAIGDWQQVEAPFALACREHGAHAIDIVLRQLTLAHFTGRRVGKHRRHAHLTVVEPEKMPHFVGEYVAQIELRSRAVVAEGEACSVQLDVRIEYGPHERANRIALGTKRYLW
jgi:hypothetical protein